jgi:primosomal protein N' (replication factor Y)
MLAQERFGLNQERYGKVLMPEIELVDLKEEYFRKKMTGHFSDINRFSNAVTLGEHK